MSGRKSRCASCSEQEDFDAQVAFGRLSEKLEQLATTVAKLAVPTLPIARSLRSADVAKVAAVDTFASADLEVLANVIKRIVGGTRTTGYPECALVGHRNSNSTISWFCTGVLVHSRIVLTAGHCFDPRAQPNVIALNVSDQNQLQVAELIEVRQAHVHPTYVQTQRISDMTVLVLRASARTPVCAVATGVELGAARKTTLVGFGNNDVNSTRGFGLKREVEVDITSIRRAGTDVLDTVEARYGYESELEFVAGGEGFDTCNGDSGGPAYIQVNGVRKVAGLTSRATDNTVNRCGDGGIYTRIDKHLSFIRIVAEAAKINDLGF